MRRPLINNLQTSRSVLVPGGTRKLLFSSFVYPREVCLASMTRTEPFSSLTFTDSGSNSLMSSSTLNTWSPPFVPLRTSFDDELDTNVVLVRGLTWSSSILGLKWSPDRLDWKGVELMNSCRIFSNSDSQASRFLSSSRFFLIWERISIWVGSLSGSLNTGVRWWCWCGKASAKVEYHSEGRIMVLRATSSCVYEIRLQTAFPLFECRCTFSSLKRWYSPEGERKARAELRNDQNS